MDSQLYTFHKIIFYDYNSTIKKKELYDLAGFIVNENNCHHRDDLSAIQYFSEEIREVYEEDLALFEHSRYYIATREQKMIGSAKVTCWDRKTTLPLEKLFGINCLNLSVCKGGESIWHVGRFAISKKENTSGILLLKKLLFLAIFPICEKRNSIMIAECDSKFVKILNMLGIQTQVLGRGISYLGSETLPIYATADWLKVFLDKNKHLISDNYIDLNFRNAPNKSVAKSLDDTCSELLPYSVAP